MKGMGKAHIPWKVCKLPYYQIPGYEERLQTRTELFPQATQLVHQQVSLIDKAIKEFTTGIERALWEIIQYSNKTVGELMELKERLRRETGAGLKEVEKTLAEDKPVLASPYGPAFRLLTEQFQTFELFSYSIKISTPEAVVAVIHPPADIQPCPFAVLYKNRLAKYNLQNGTTFSKEIDQYKNYKMIRDLENIKQVQQPDALDNIRKALAQKPLKRVETNRSYIQLDRATLMIVDFEVKTLDILTYELTNLDPLLTPRSYSGVAMVNTTVFAFGGEDGAGVNKFSVCEKYSLPHNCWTRLPEMHYARTQFTPCNFKALLYLAGTCPATHRAVESFNPQSETFTVLPISLPPDLRLGCSSVAFVAYGELYLLTDSKQKACWRIELESEFRLSDTDKQCWSSQQPRITGTQVLIACGSKVLLFSLETDTFK